MHYKETISALSIALTIIAFYPYLRGILQGNIKPHVFSWVIWGTTTFVVFLAQLKANGGVGAWPIGISGVITILIAISAYAKRADIAISKVDWSHKGPGHVGYTQSPQPEIHAGIKSFTSEDCSIPTIVHMPSFFSVVKYKPHDLTLSCRPFVIPPGFGVDSGKNV